MGRPAKKSLFRGQHHGKTKLRIAAGLDHDDFGLNQSKIINVIDSKSLERDAGKKPNFTLARPALAAAFVAASRLARDQPVSLLQKSDRLAGGAQRAIIHTRPYRRQGPVSGTFGIVSRLD
jgi:hypothetical protein